MNKIYNLELLKNVEAFDFDWDLEVEAMKKYDEEDFIDVIEYIEDNIKYMKDEILDKIDYYNMDDEVKLRKRELLKMIAKNIKFKHVIELEYTRRYEK